MLKKYIQEAIQGYQTPQKSCSCGCGGCDTAPKIALLETKATYKTKVYGITSIMASHCKTMYLE